MKHGAEAGLDPTDDVSVRPIICQPILPGSSPHRTFLILFITSDLSTTGLTEFLSVTNHSCMCDCVLIELESLCHDNSV